jgi:CRISPR-associated protein Csm5
MKYKLKIETLSPLHIGTGVELLKDFDYVPDPEKQCTYVLNQDAVYMDEFERGGLNRLQTRAGNLYSLDHWRTASQHVNYILHGPASLNSVHEQIKAPDYSLYIPGSSLKGAIRTSLLSFFKKAGLLEAKVNYKPNKKGGYVGESADDYFEQEAFIRKSLSGEDRNLPNYDLLKALYLRDSSSLKALPSLLSLYSVKVSSQEADEIPIEVEAISPGVTFEGEVIIDELLLTFTNALKILDWQENVWVLFQLIPILKLMGVDTYQQHRQKIAQYPILEPFYQKMEAQVKQMSENTILMQMGWGAGWSSMTIGESLAKQEIDEAREKFQLGKPPRAARTWQADLTTPFPKSKRLAKTGYAGQAIPFQEFGWVALNFEEQPGSPDVGTSIQINQMKQHAASEFDKVKPKIEAAQVEREKSFTKQDPRKAVVSSTSSWLEIYIFITEFTTKPETGNRFRGKVLDVESDGKVYIILPGLDEDETIGIIKPENNPKKSIKPGSMILCEIVEVKPDRKPNTFIIYCLVEI